MMDFLKAYPSVSKEEYLWEWTVPQVELAAADNTHIEYLSEEQAKRERDLRTAVIVDDPMDLVNDLGVPVFKKKK